MKISRIYVGIMRTVGVVLLCLVVASTEGESAGTSREIFDRSNGSRWILQRDETGSAGPGRLVLITSPTSPVRSENQEDVRSYKRAGKASTVPVPIIHPGQSLIVEEHTAKIEVCLEAV